MVHPTYDFGLVAINSLQPNLPSKLVVGKILTNFSDNKNKSSLWINRQLIKTIVKQSVNYCYLNYGEIIFNPIKWCDDKLYGQINCPNRRSG